MDYYDDCQALMTTLMGAAVVTQFETFNAKCIRRNDVPTLLGMVRSMSLQGCTADAGVDAIAVADGTAGGFGAADGIDAHFTVELGDCNYANIDAKTAAVDRACCSGVQGDVCAGGVPSVCDIECAIHYVPFHEDCNALLAGTMDQGMASYEELYGQCLTNSRRGASQLLRTMYLTNEFHNTDDCPVEGALDYFGDCPGQEPECIAEFIGVQPDLAANNIFPFYRIQVLDNWGSTIWCMKEMSLRGANNCIYDTRPMATEMQRTYADSNNGDGTGYSWQHYTDNCNACPSGNTNSYGPDNLFDDPISYPSAGGDFCTDSEHTFGFASINMTVPTLITSYKLRARNWNEFPKHFVFQGSNDWVTWTDIETRYISKKMATNEERVFWVGVPANTPGIPDVTMDAFNVNPLGYMTLDPVTQQIVDSAADRTNICVLGDNDAMRGRAPPPAPPAGDGATPTPAPTGGGGH